LTPRHCTSSRNILPKQKAPNQSRQTSIEAVTRDTISSYFTALRNGQDVQMQAALDRHFNLTGASNFRDLGGYAGKDGRTVRWRHIFRSNHLGHLTEADIAVLRGLGLRNAFDFRGAEERAAAACAIAEITVHSLPVEPTVVAALRTRLASGKAVSPTDGIEVMHESYIGYVRQNTERYRSLFAH